MVLRRLKSRTRTFPRLTRVSVPLQRSSTSHLVPTTVAALCLPLVRNRPLPSPHSRRLRFLLAAAFAFPPPPHCSFPVIASVVSGWLPLRWVTLKTPRENHARCVGPATLLAAAARFTRSLLVSNVVPT